MKKSWRTLGVVIGHWRLLANFYFYDRSWFYSSEQDVPLKGGPCPHRDGEVEEPSPSMVSKRWFPGPRERRSLVVNRPEAFTKEIYIHLQGAEEARATTRFLMGMP